jgi:hypothetical protein
MYLTAVLHIVYSSLTSLFLMATNPTLLLLFYLFVIMIDIPMEFFHFYCNFVLRISRRKRNDPNQLIRDTGRAAWWKKTKGRKSRDHVPLKRYICFGTDLRFPFPTLLYLSFQWQNILKYFFILFFKQIFLLFLLNYTVDSVHVCVTIWLNFYLLKNNYF